ncbi:SLAM family member 8-like [Aquarana catesbeiana]|uniref:SLAM family member 8-like n=1 Tax=Aquarana catesbeiana TaxID=8400 RepID=UPI003CC999AE
MRVVGATCQILPTLLLLTLTGRLCDAEELTHITGIQGGSVFLLPLVPSGFNPREVFWRHLSPIDHLVASFSRGSLDTTYQSCFHGRVKLLQNFTLEILGLDLRDTGMFTCQMVDTQGHMQLHRFYLSVYEVAAKPEVQVFVSRQGQDCALFLSCNVTTGNNVTYSWIVDTGQEGSLHETYRLYDEKRLLRMTLNSTHQDVSFTCVVTNPVSQENTSVIPWTSCVTEPGKPNEFALLSVEDVSQLTKPLLHKLFGQDFKTNNGKIVILVAAALIIMFTTAMICVYFFSRTSGKTPVKGRQRTNIHTGETFLQLEEENDSPELTGLQDNEETTAQQNGEMTLGHNTDQDSIEERTVQFSPETIVTHKVETIV